jgi:hypothetical protein
MDGSLETFLRKKVSSTKQSSFGVLIHGEGANDAPWLSRKIAMICSKAYFAMYIDMKTDSMSILDLQHGSVVQRVSLGSLNSLLDVESAMETMANDAGMLNQPMEPSSVNTVIPKRLPVIFSGIGSLIFRFSSFNLSNWFNSLSRKGLLGPFIIHYNSSLVDSTNTLQQLLQISKLVIRIDEYPRASGVESLDVLNSWSRSGAFLCLEVSSKWSHRNYVQYYSLGKDGEVVFVDAKPCEPFAATKPYSSPSQLLSRSHYQMEIKKNDSSSIHIHSSISTNSAPAERFIPTSTTSSHDQGTNHSNCSSGHHHHSPSSSNVKGSNVSFDVPDIEGENEKVQQTIKRTTPTSSNRINRPKGSSMRDEEDGPLSNVPLIYVEEADLVKESIRYTTDNSKQTYEWNDQEAEDLDDDLGI